MDRRGLLLWISALAAALFASCGGGSAPPPPAPQGEESKAPEAEAEAASDVVTSPNLVEMRTSMGTMKIELYPDQAPATVENFRRYVREGFYDGTIFHRVIRGFMIQGGGFTPDMVEKENHAPIENEAGNGLKNLRGTLAMARTGDPHSATSQFFINGKDNAFLDHTEPTVRGFGYAVFGKVIEGLDVLDAIEKVPTTSRGGHDDVPVDPVIIESVRLAN
jgi:peptidyl-prolyl cis-trans isomerase B (cyclophilin B)